MALAEEDAYAKVSANTASSEPKTANFKVVIQWGKSSKRLILCMYMTFKVIKCIEITQNTQILKIADFGMAI